MADFIDREILMKFPIRRDHCDKEHANEHFINGIETVMEYAENLPTADVEPVKRWIPCSERLPEGVNRCLVCRYDYVTKTRFVDILWLEHGSWWNRLHGGNYAVTHWMPLPEPPKEGGGDNEM